MAEQLPTASQRGFFTVQHPGDYHPDWAAFYANALAARTELADVSEHAVHLPYGSNEHQVLNVYGPPGADGAPVLLFFHGGRWREGHPDFYDHLGRAWVESGAIFVSAGYRKQPDASFEDCCDDAVAAIRWVREEISEHGGDPGRIVVAGHSSGGHIAAMATLTDWAERTGPELGELLGGVYMSAPVDFDWMPEGSEHPPSPLSSISRSPRRVVVSYGDPEPNRKQDDDRLLTRQGHRLAEALHDRGVQQVVMPNTDHVASAAVLNDPAGPLFPVVQRILFAETESR